MLRVARAFFFLLVLPLLMVVVAYRRFAASIRREVDTMIAHAARPEPKLVTEATLKGLPEPVQRYMRFSGVVGRPIPATVRLTQTGRIRRGPDQPWLDLHAEEFYSVNPPGFVWSVSAGSSFPVIRGSDHYLDGKGRMQIRLLSLFPLVDADGEEMDQGAFMRYLNEMTWFPAAFLGDNVSWTAIDDHSAQVTLTDHGKTVSAVMHFDADGRLLEFVADRYYQIDGGKRYEFRRWTTPFTEYGELAGLRLPVKGKAVWTLDDGDFEYAELGITGIEYLN